MQSLSNDGSKKVQFPGTPGDSIPSQKMKETTNKYCKFVSEIIFDGKKDHYNNPPQDSIADNCRITFNKKLEGETRSYFVSRLETFRKEHGPWQIKYKEIKTDDTNNSVAMRFSVNFDAVSHKGIVQLQFNKDYKIEHIVDDLEDPKRGEPTFHVGINKYLSHAGPKFEPTGFETFFKLNPQETEQFRQKALDYYKERFGIDELLNTVDPKTGISNPDFMILPVTFGEPSYTISKSRLEKIPAEINGIPTRIQIAEFVLVFNPTVEGKNYGGTYGKKPIEPTDNISYGRYRILLGDGRHYDVFMESKVPNKSLSKENHVLVKLNLRSQELGLGKGSFLAHMKFAKEEDGPNQGLFKTYVDGKWYFPNIPGSK